jgi:diadenosine tetraphosphate (Ap4A) HIT family hydrolase
MRVILAAEPDYPGFTRVIWQAHLAEMTDLSPPDRDALMRVVCTVESVQREAFAPDKINLASFGNMVPHLHWHVIPRWRDDRHFPDPVWGRAATGRDDAIAARRAATEACLPAYLDLLRARLAGA